jgi:hypothetical protein
MVPQHSGSFPSPPGRLDQKVAAVGSDEEVGTRKHVESMAYACSRAAVVENYDFGYERPSADPHSPAIGHVLDSLLEPGCRQLALVAVPAGERHRRRQDQGAVRHYARPAKSLSATDLPPWVVSQNIGETPVIAAPYVGRPHHKRTHRQGSAGEPMAGLSICWRFRHTTVFDAA